MKEEDKILKKVGTENHFSVPEGYFETLTSEVMTKLPEKEKPAFTMKAPTRWDRVKPWIYMAAMFAGAALIIRTASVDKLPQNELAAVGTEIELVSDEYAEEYIDAALNQAMLDDYSLYVYLASDSGE